MFPCMWLLVKRQMLPMKRLRGAKKTNKKKRARVETEMWNTSKEAELKPKQTSIEERGDRQEWTNLAAASLVENKEYNITGPAQKV